MPRLGQMTELDALLKSVEGHAFSGSATERITGAREGLWNMQNPPGDCLPLRTLCPPPDQALALIQQNPGTELIYTSASTQQGFSLPQVAELSQQLGLSFQMAFREKDAAFVVPSVAHLKVDHFAADHPARRRSLPASRPYIWE